MIAKYNAKYLPVDMGAMREAVKTMAQTNFAAYAAEYEAKHLLMRNILDAAGVATPAYFCYYAFFGEMFHVYKNFAGSSAAQEAAVLVAKYVAFGCATLALLEQIRNDVFNIDAPAV